MRTRLSILALVSALSFAACAGSQTPAETTVQAEPEDGLTPVADGTRGVALDFVAGDSSFRLTLSPPTEHGSWMARFSDREEAVNLDDLCARESADYGIFPSVREIVSTGYSRVLSSTVIVLQVGTTFDDSGHYEPQETGVLFWQDGAPVCWTIHNSAPADRDATGLFTP